MVNLTEAVAASLVGFLFFTLTASHIKNSGTLEDASAPVTATNTTTAASSVAMAPPVVNKAGAMSASVHEPSPAAYGSSADLSMLYASGEGLQGTSAACSNGNGGPGGVEAQGPLGLATSLLPQNTAKLDDADFVGITPDDSLKQINFLNAGWQIGRDTQLNTLRNPSYDLRSEPANPRTLTPENNLFLNSTIGFDSRRQFEPSAAYEVEK